MNRKVHLNVPNLQDEYLISSDGYVENVTKAYILKGTSITKNNRYVKIHLDKFYALHRLVAQHFVPNPHGHSQVNHIDGNRYNNAAANLEWVTASSNVRHAYRTGLKSNAGETNPISILTEAQVRAILALKDTSLTARQIRDRLKLPVGVAAVKQVRSRRAWKHIML